MQPSPGYQPVSTTEESNGRRPSLALQAECGEIDEENLSLLSDNGEVLHDQNLNLKERTIFRLRQKQPRLSKVCIAISASVVAVLAILIALIGVSFFQTVPPYGQSPPWYPTPLGGTLASWSESYDKAKTMVDKMSLVEKVNVTTGTGWSMDLCVGNTGPALEAGFPSMCLQDGPLGIRWTDHATSFPAGLTVGATWNKTLMRMRGAAHGKEARLKGINVLLGPAMGPIGRHPAGGRGWEGFGADPVLQAVGAFETIQGIQSQGVIATAKHLVANEQEHFRRPLEWGLPHSLSTNIDDRTMHEIYSWPFAESVRAGVGSVMCSYQMINNSYGCENSALMNGLLKDEYGFQGFVQSDWTAQRSGVASALAGLDVSMPGDGLQKLGGISLWGDQMTIAILNGSMPIERLNDMVTRIVASWYQLGQDFWNSSGPNFSAFTKQKVGHLHPGAEDTDDIAVVNQFVDAAGDHHILARQVASEGVVLLKNVDNMLPLHIDPKLKTKIAIIGEDAGPGKGPNACGDKPCNQGTLASGWGSGSTEFDYLVDPAAALSEALNSTSDVTTHLHNEPSSELRRIAAGADICLCFANADSGEGFLRWENVRGDRNDLNLQKDGDALIQAVASSCPNTVVIIHSVGAVMVEEWADHPHVKAIVFAHLPGQESGNALVDFLFGHVDASGRLPYTVGKSLDEYGPNARVMYYPNAVIPQANFDEGLYFDYRYFDKFNLEPRYPFGFGLSYTQFEFTDLNVTEVRPRSPLPSPRPIGIDPPAYNEELPNPSAVLFPKGFRRFQNYIYPWINAVDEVKPGKYPYPDGYDVHHTLSAAGGGEGGNPSLFETHCQIQTTVRNVGSRRGQAVVQIYISFPDGVTDIDGSAIDFPVRVLRGFEKVELDEGESTVVSLDLTRKDLSYWSVVQQNWVMPEGKIGIQVGQHSRDAFLEGYY